MKDSTNHLLTWSRRLALAAGAMDFGTGLGLVFAPVPVLHLMGVPPVAADALVLVRWIGVFVGAVGASYLWPLIRGGIDRLRHAFEITLLFRAAVGTFVFVAWTRGLLPAAWLCVSATDWTLAVLQGWLLAKGGWHEGD